MTGQHFQITAAHREALRSLQARPKFDADRSLAYAGAPLRIRAQCEAALDEVLAQLLELPGAVQAEAVHKIVRRSLQRIDAFDSQERDRFCAYLEQSMDLLGIADATALLNKWRYGMA
jgi:hypothetical protein